MLGPDGRPVGTDDEGGKVKSRRRRDFLFVLVLFRRRRRPPLVHIRLRLFNTNIYMSFLLLRERKEKGKKEKK